MFTKTSKYIDEILSKPVKVPSLQVEEIKRKAKEAKENVKI